MRGNFALILHSHLPYYRKAGMWPFGEENLYEAIAETYLPLIAELETLAAEGIMARFTVGITPILAEQLADPYLKDGFERYVETRVGFAEADIARFDSTDPRHGLARFYQVWYLQQLERFRSHDRDPLKAFRALQDRGCIELITSAATHGFSPLLGRDSSLHAQFRVGVETYRKHFGRDPKGIWLPECAYRPRQDGRAPIDAFLREEGLGFFITDSHAIEGGRVTGFHAMGPYEHLRAPESLEYPETGLTTYEAYALQETGVAVVARNERAGYQVWSGDFGYPGDAVYREFHRKDSESGLHYWRLTGKNVDLGQKELYDPTLAFDRVRQHAEHYAGMLSDLFEGQEGGLIAVPFDTELFGHWWFEGISWLGHLVRALDRRAEVKRVSVSEYLEQHPPGRRIALPPSTWGAGGGYWVWDNPDVQWMWPIIHRAEARMENLAARYEGTTDPLYLRALNQAGRELLLLQSSDWPFLVTTGQAKDYAVERFRGHEERFNVLAAQLEEGRVEVGALEAIEGVDNPFAGLEYRHFAPYHALA